MTGQALAVLHGPQHVSRRAPGWLGVATLPGARAHESRWVPEGCKQYFGCDQEFYAKCLKPHEASPAIPGGKSQKNLYSTRTQSSDSSPPPALSSPLRSAVSSSNPGGWNQKRRTGRSWAQSKVFLSSTFYRQRNQGVQRTSLTVSRFLA